MKSVLSAGGDELSLFLCSTCGRPMPKDAPESLCPACLLQLAADLGPESAGSAAADAESSAAASTPLGMAGQSTAGQSTAGPQSTSVQDVGVFPRAFGRYELRQLLGEGNMGRVYMAHDPKLDRCVALKMPKPQGSAQWRERFLAEARAAAKVVHPNVCPIHEVDEVEGQPFLTMEFVDGETLAARLDRQGPFTPAAAADLVGTLARAIHVAHRHGIVHRDLKPGNIMVDRSERPMITDFGLALRLSGADDMRLTATGFCLGTPAYMSPEQANGDHDAIGPGTDVYALGVILYQLVTGCVPFQAEPKQVGKLMAQIQRDAPPPPSTFNSNVDAALEAIIMTALAKAPGDRFASAGDLADALDRYRDGDHFGIAASYARPYRIPEAAQEYRPAAPAAKAKPRRRLSPILSWITVASFLLGCIGTLAAVIYIRTDYGDLEVRLSDPEAKVAVRVNGQEVTLSPEGGKPIRIRAGENQMLEVSGEGYETEAKSFDLKRNGRTIVEVTLKPKDLSPTVTIAATDSTAAEPSDPGAFTVTRTGATTAALTVNYTISGTATNGTDYTMLSGSVVIPIGAASAPIAVLPINDALAEPSETVIATLAAGSYTIGAANSATVTIADDDGSRKLVTFPAGQTLVELANWHILTDATKEEMQAWLKERREANHSVVWLDAVQVGDKPVFAAIAALDQRQTGWQAFLDLSDKEAINTALLGKRLEAKGLDLEQHVIASLCGFTDKDGITMAALLRPQFSQWRVGVLPIGSANERVIDFAAKGFSAQLVRPFPVGDDVFRCALYFEAPVAGKPPLPGLKMNAAELAAELEKYRKDGLRPLSVVAYVDGGELRFATTSRRDASKALWEVQHNLTAADLKTKARELAKKGFQPSCVTAYPWDGAVRYCAIWVKEPVEYPKTPTVIAGGGWEIITGVRQEEMQKWLNKRKDAKHSVTWLDVVEVAGEPLYSAVAALDNRKPDWFAFLNEPTAALGDGRILKIVDINAQSVVSFSGFSEKTDTRCAALWHKGFSPLQFVAANGLFGDLTILDEKFDRTDQVFRLLRPHPVAGGVPRICLSAQQAVGEKKKNYVYEATAEEMAAFVKACQDAGERITSFAAYPNEGELRYAVVGAANPAKVAWKWDHGLTAEQLQAKSAAMAKERFRAGILTAVPWDGAVRYCVVWVKEPPRPVSLPKGPTVMTNGDWEVLTGATQEQMQKWLDERKDAEHSVTWLDVVEVAGEPLYSAVAALDKRKPDWHAFLDIPANEWNTSFREKLLDMKKHRPMAISGFARETALLSASLWYRGFVPHMSIPDATVADMKKFNALIDPHQNVVRALRPYSAGNGLVGFAAATERVIGEKSGNYLYEATLEEMLLFVKARQDVGERIIGLAAYATDGSCAMPWSARPIPRRLHGESTTG